MGFEGIGASVRRKEDRRFLSGRGNYTDDINRPGQLHAVLRRSDRRVGPLLVCLFHVSKGKQTIVKCKQS